jgi:excisionase family DNA binding protein
MKDEQKIVLDFSSLSNTIKSSLMEEINELKKQFENFKKPTEPFLKRKEVLVMLGISSPTLKSWVNKKVLTQYKLGSRAFFKREEIEELLNKNSSK